MYKVVLPPLGENIEQATISYWYFKKGDKIGLNDDLVELATDKATFNLPSPAAGIIAELFVNEGDTVKVGDELASIVED